MGEWCFDCCSPLRVRERARWGAPGEAEECGDVLGAGVVAAVGRGAAHAPGGERGHHRAWRTRARGGHGHVRWR